MAGRDWDVFLNSQHVNLSGFEEKAHTDPYCLTDAPGEKARVALFGPAGYGHVVVGGKHQNSARSCRISHRTRDEADSSAVVFVL